MSMKTRGALVNSEGITVNSECPHLVLGAVFVCLRVDAIDDTLNVVKSLWNTLHFEAVRIDRRS